MKYILNILIFVAVVADILLFSSKASEYVAINNKYDSIQTELKSFDEAKYKQFLIYCNLVDTLFNYHQNSISRQKLIDFFEYNGKSYLEVKNQSEYKFNDTKITFSFRDSQLVCNFPLYYRLDTTINEKFIFKKDFLFYLQNKYTN
ncbi:MAG: hypothetical protein MJ211_15200 [Bacteroidales bacterium]|nr:hypothetical protein [Bacteroidales bacterium]